MHALLVALRLIHILLGVFWAGTIFFMALFLEPSVRAAGPDGAKVMQGLMQRRYFNIMPLIALLTILSGLALYWHVSGGLEPTWMRSRLGMSLTFGAVAAMVGFVIGVFVMRPIALRLFALGPAAQQLPEGPEKAAAMAELQRLRGRAMVSGRWVAALLGVAVTGMAVARYL